MYEFLATMNQNVSIPWRVLSVDPIDIGLCHAKSLMRSTNANAFCVLSLFSVTNKMMEIPRLIKVRGYPKAPCKKWSNFLRVLAEQSLCFHLPSQNKLRVLGQSISNIFRWRRRRHRRHRLVFLTQATFRVAFLWQSNLNWWKFSYK